MASWHLCHKAGSVAIGFLDKNSQLSNTFLFSQEILRLDIAFAVCILLDSNSLCEFKKKGGGEENRQTYSVTFSSYKRAVTVEMINLNNRMKSAQSLLSITKNRNAGFYFTLETFTNRHMC